MRSSGSLAKLPVDNQFAISHRVRDMEVRPVHRL